MTPNWIAVAVAGISAFVLGGIWYSPALYGFLAGVWIFCGIAIVGLFELKTGRYILINGGYCFFALGLMGAILGAWR